METVKARSASARVFLTQMLRQVALKPVETCCAVALQMLVEFVTNIKLLIDRCIVGCITLHECIINSCSQSVINAKTLFFFCAFSVGSCGYTRVLISCNV